MTIPPAIKPRGRRAIAVATAAAMVLAVLSPSAFGADTQLLLVHGYGSSSKGKDCNGSTWRNALRYGWSPLKTAFQAATKIGDGFPR